MTPLQAQLNTPWDVLLTLGNYHRKGCFSVASQLALMVSVRQQYFFLLNKRAWISAELLEDPELLARLSIRDTVAH